MNKKGAPKKCKDHLGNTYSSIKMMCLAYGVNYKAYGWRVSHGYTVEEALLSGTDRIRRNSEKGFNGVKCEDHLGNKYNSISEMCRKYGMDRKRFYHRIKSGWTLEDALTKGKQKSTGCNRVMCEDHLGNTYGSIREMCAEYNITEGMLYQRMKSGWTLEDALTRERQCDGRKREHHVYAREYIESLNELRESYNIDLNAYYNGISLVQTTSDVLTI